MKISKLFHWLYGLVMLLPVFAIGVTCGYAIFNKNAYQSYYGENVNEESFVDNNLSYIDNNKYYYFNTQNYSNTNTSFHLYTNSFEVVDNGNLSSSQLNSLSNNSNISIYCRANMTSEFYVINENNTYTWVTNTSSFVCRFKINNVNGSINNPVGFYIIEYNKVSFVSEVFYYSIDRVRDSSLFNWAYDSFLVTPFAYIVNLFSMPTNSFVVMLLSYWLAISIIWLVFDLIMYIPLLVHRWLDKGVLE